jgi:hypothetical protein
MAQAREAHDADAGVVVNKIAAVVSFAAMDYKFLAPCLKELRKFCDQIVVSYGDHLYDGTPENLDLIEKAKTEHRDIQFAKFSYDPKFKSLGTLFWGGFQRVVGLELLLPSIEYVLLVDVDEIIESTPFIRLLNESNYRDYNVLTFATYWYFGSTSNQATQLESGPLVLVKRRLVRPGWLITPADRRILENILPDPKLNMVTYGADPLVHHYSWVRNREEMLQKVISWGHNKDRDWVKLVEEYFALPESERTGDRFKDFVHGYTFRPVKPYISFDEA